MIAKKKTISHRDAERKERSEAKQDGGEREFISVGCGSVARVLVVWAAL